MRILFVLICSLALASLAPGAEEGKKKEQKKGAQTGQVSRPGGKPTGAGKPAQYGKAKGQGRAANANKPAEYGKAKGAGKGKTMGEATTVGQPGKTGNAAATGMPTGKGKGKGKAAEAGTAAGAGEVTTTGKGGGKKAGAGKPAETTATTTAAKGAAAAKPFKPQRFNLASKSKPATSVAPAVTFHQNRRIEGSQNWQGSNYQVFRNYRSEWHDRNWWHSHSGNVVFIFGGWYALNGGYWYPAWGYDPNEYYAYDGPIYAYNNLPPDQVVANVQAALQEQGYYHGEVDGLLGPLTRAAIADYQRDHGLYMTSTIDQPTLQTLGMT